VNNPEVSQLFMLKCLEMDMTKREVEVALLILEGLSNLDISAILKIKIKSVKDFAGRIYKKSGYKNRSSFIVNFHQTAFDQLTGLPMGLACKKKK